METPVFEEFDPVSDCDCPGCRHRRPALPHSRAVLAAPAHRAVIVATAAATALATAPAAAVHAAAHAPGRPGVPADDEPGTPQGVPAPLHGPAGRPTGPAAGTDLPGITRAEIIDRAGEWVAAKVPYSMTAYWSDGYRQDCSGYVSMAWKLPGNEWTGSLGRYADRISKEELQPGDILLFHNPADPRKGSHVVIFGGWTDHTHTSYTAYEQTRPRTRKKTTPYAYRSNSGKFLPYRYKGLAASAAGGVPRYPGRAMFRPGADNAHVTQLGEQLVEKGFGRHYTTGPGPRWGEGDRRGVEAFQRAQGWRGGAADGYPGPETWRRLFS
ncbi:peptidoglycan-binding protein [Streptomyces viridiviolaceus]